MSSSLNHDGGGLSGDMGSELGDAPGNLGKTRRICLGFALWLIGVNVVAILACSDEVSRLKMKVGLCWMLGLSVLLFRLSSQFGNMLSYRGPGFAQCFVTNPFLL